MSTSVSRFIVRFIDCYDSTSDESDDEFDLAEFSEYSLSSQSIPKVSDCANLTTAPEPFVPQTGSIQQIHTTPYKIDVPPIVIPSPSMKSTKSTKYSPSTSFPSLPSSYESSTESYESSTESTSVTPSDLSRTSLSMTPTATPCVPLQFDSDCGPCSLSTNGFHCGFHEWTVKVIKTDLLHQEIGVVSKAIGNVEPDELVRDNPVFGARAVYGNIEGHAYYASYNMNNSCRCYRSLSTSVKAWRDGDEIKICLDMDKGSITFYLNGKRVRKSISVQRNIMFYPFISNGLHSEYMVVNYTTND